MPTNLRKWSTTATGNATVAGGANTINFAEGQNPSTVNNSAREMMAQVRGWYTAAEASWIEQSNTASIASQTVFKLSGDQTANWTANRRWRLRGGSTTRYGSVVSSSYTAETTITVTVDSGSLSASHSIAALASITSDHIPANTYVTSASLATALGTYVTSSSLATALAPYITSASITTVLGTYITSNSSSVAIAAAVASVGMTLLGSIDTSSGTSATLGSLTLTSYKALFLVLDTVSTDGDRTLLIGNSTSDDVTFTQTSGGTGFNWKGTVTIDLGTGIGSSVLNLNGANTSSIAFDSALSTSTTTISVAPSSGNLDSGSITVYGMR